ncbi:MAG: carbamoyl-phosphate synthase large subunit [Acidimicrobiia bacterium]|nr:carbamoyl-phosphate synthase large subunit [Acidimicrobiia bacterium]
MPRRNDIKSILVIGSGPIVIGQACEFDYSGTQACRVLRREGYRVILVNSNPATIMTDPDFADATYVEPLDVETIERIIARERPDAVLPTIGGQTALNLAIELHDAGVLKRYGVEMIGASVEAIHTAEDRSKFKVAMAEIGLATPNSGLAHSVEEALVIGGEIGYPVIVRPSFILGGSGTGFAGNDEELRAVATRGISASPIAEILVEQSVLGWKEYELEVMRDNADNVVVVCSIENFDPMGVHTGDSITVAPAQTLSDVEYQSMREAAFACIRRIGVETGGSNIQFAVNPANGEVVVIEMNPRVSRSSALASKATGFPIAKIAACLAVGYRLDEIANDITKKTPASFEPSIDYVVTKIPRWAFEKLPGARGVLGTQMQSVGEVMALGRTFPESLQKALRSLEIGRLGLNADPQEGVLDAKSDDDLLSEAAIATPDRIFKVEAALRRGLGVTVVNEATGIDPWFLQQILDISEARAEISATDPATISAAQFRAIKRLGFSDGQLAYIWKIDAPKVRQSRLALGVVATFKTVDTCAAEFAAETPYYYATYEDEDEVSPLKKPAVIILGSGPNRIGQGVEFDYCCVHAAFALSEAGFESVMINCNPETVSTDYDTSDRLFFEPLTVEEVTNVIDVLSDNGEPLVGVIVALGGQTPLKLASVLEEAGVPILGTSPASIDLSEDRAGFHKLCDDLDIPQPPGGTAIGVDQAIAVAGEVGFPVLVRPSYVLGGRAMRIVYDEESLTEAMTELAEEGSLGREGGLSAQRPALIDRFLEDAVEVDVDAIRDRAGEVLVGGIMEHIEEAGVHSGDSACALPPPTLPPVVIEEIEKYTRALAAALDVCGLINIQFAVKDSEVFILEANPRASRTIPFVSKATGVPLAKVAARVIVGSTLAELRVEGLLSNPARGNVAVKEAVLPFNRFPEVDTILGPEMRSTGEVMGIDKSFGRAFAKSQSGAGNQLPEAGTVFFSLADRDKDDGVRVATQLAELGFSLAATSGTAKALELAGVSVAMTVAKVGEKSGEDAVALISSGKVSLVINTPRGRGSRLDGAHIRAAALRNNVACITTAAAALAAVNGIADRAAHPAEVLSLQEYHQTIGGGDK